MVKTLSLALATAMLSGGVAKAQTQTFASSAGFSVTYPKNWTRLGADPGKLDAVSPGQRVEGLIIGPRQAELRVQRIQLDSGAAQRIWLKGERAISGANQTPPPSNCSAAITEDDEGQGPPDRTYALFCGVVREAVFQVTVRYWADDPKWKAYQKAAVATANSFRAKVPQPL